MGKAEVAAVPVAVAVVVEEEEEEEGGIGGDRGREKEVRG